MVNIDEVLEEVQGFMKNMEKELDQHYYTQNTTTYPQQTTT